MESSFTNDYEYDPLMDTMAPKEVISPGAMERQVGGEHYKNLAIQPIEYIVRNNLGWLEGNAVKYITRHKQKGERKDIEKAIHYLQIILEGYDNGTN